MGKTLELVYQYRQLMGRFDAGTGLDIDEIGTLALIEARLGAPPSTDAHDWRSADSAEDMTAVVRGYRLDDEVVLINLGPDGCVCRRAPYAEEGRLVEIIVDGGHEQGRPRVSYRFMARVTWLQDDTDDFALGLSFVGVPIQVRYRTVGALAEGDRAAA